MGVGWGGLGRAARGVPGRRGSWRAPSRSAARGAQTAPPGGRGRRLGVSVCPDEPRRFLPARPHPRRRRKAAGQVENRAGSAGLGEFPAGRHWVRARLSVRTGLQDLSVER